MSYEIDVTELADDAYTMSGSRAEWGEGAASFTWRNCVRRSEEMKPINDDNRDEVRSFVRSFGAWSREEIDGWDDTELGALLIQFAAADIREAENVSYDDEGNFDREEYERQVESGRVSGRLYYSEDGKIWFSFAN